MTTELDLRVVNHESAHAVAAYLLGLRVNWVSADRHALLDRWGETHTSLKPDDDRPDALKLADKAVVCLIAVLFEPGGPGQSDGDVEKAYTYGMRARAGQDWIDAASARARDLLGSEAFRRGVNALSAVLLEEGSVNGPRAEAIVRAAVGE